MDKIKNNIGYIIAFLLPVLGFGLPWLFKTQKSRKSFLSKTLGLIGLGTGAGIAVITMHMKAQQDPSGARKLTEVGKEYQYPRAH